MKPIRLGKNSIILSALWFGVSAAIQAVLVLGFWSVIVPRTAYAPAIIWSFLSGALIGMPVWHIHANQTLVGASYSTSTAALRGGIIGPASLLAAFVLDTLFDYLTGQLNNIQDPWQISADIVLAVVISLGVPIVFFSAMSGVLYAAISRKMYLRPES